MINFWSSSCAVCKSETRALVQVAGATRGRVRFLGIDTDDLRGPAEAFAARYHIPYPLSFDPQGVVAARYRLPGLPVTFFLSRPGWRSWASTPGRSQCARSPRSCVSCTAGPPDARTRASGRPGRR